MVDMSADDLASGIQFVVDGRGDVTSVELSPETWQRLIARLTDAEDRETLASLAPKRSHGPEGALRWSDVEHEWA